MVIAALGLPLALLLGIVADLTTAVVVRTLGGERRWFGVLTDRWGEIRRLWGDGRAGERVAVVEAVGAAGALFGAGVAAAAALGAVPGTLPLVYLALLAAAGGAHLAASVPRSEEAMPAAAAARLRAALVEPAFAVALGAVFLRWAAIDLEAVGGAQEVLGPGITVGPPLALAGLVVSGSVVVVAGAARAAPVPSGEPAGASMVLVLSRWAAAGATALVVAGPLAGPVSASGADAIRPLAVALGAAVLVGAAGAVVGRVRGRFATVSLGLLTLLAAGGAALVALA